MKNEIELRLQGGLLSNWCAEKAAQSERFLYQTGFDSTYRVIRFSTHTVASLFTLAGKQSGHWKNGHCVMYEIRNAADGISLSCTASPVGLNQRECARMKKLAESCGTGLQNGTYRLVKWDLSDGTGNINLAIEKLNQVFDFELSYFETELTAWKEDPTRKIRSMPHSQQEKIRNTDLPETLYIEGAQKQILSNQYERNPRLAHAASPSMALPVRFAALILVLYLERNSLERLRFIIRSRSARSAEVTWSTPSTISSPFVRIAI